MMVDQSERLLTRLSDTPLLDGYCFAIYSPSKAPGPDKICWHLCGTRGIPHLCHKICLPSLNAAMDEALGTGNPVFFLCPLGLLSFAVPVSPDSCLVCSGKRENLFDLYFHRSEQLDFLQEINVYPFEILEKLEELPVSTEKEVRETMSKVEELVASLASEAEAQPVDAAACLQNTFMDVAASIDRAESIDKAVALFSEIFGILFDIPAMALVLKNDESDGFIIKTCWGPSPAPSCPYAKTFPFQGDSLIPVTLTGDDLMELFPGSRAASATCLPLMEDFGLFGMAVLFDSPLSIRELSLCEILTRRLVAKLKEYDKERETWRKERTGRLLDMIRTLALTENRDDLQQMVVVMAAELVGASSGSLMIADRNGKTLRVVSALGMNTALARCLSAEIGEGIAGRVAATGVPFLIRDIEREQCCGRTNRVRFGTKSCLSLPLQLKGTIVGVLNLADKKNGSPFTPLDQEVLTTFLEQAAINLKRSTVLKKARMNAITDPLTGLYTLRFLKKRLNEELSRSIRHNLQLTVIFIRVTGFTGRQSTEAQVEANRLAKEIARILTASLRDIDLVGRSGELEFCLVLPATPKREGTSVAERVMGNVRAQQGKENGPLCGESIHLSAGIASFPEEGATAADLIKAARIADSPGGADEGDKPAILLPSLSAPAAAG